MKETNAADALLTMMRTRAQPHKNPPKKVPAARVTRLLNELSEQGLFSEQGSWSERREVKPLLVALERELE